jgi:hypothetical protein
MAAQRQSASFVIRFEGFISVRIEIVILVFTPCNFVDDYQHFREPAASIFKVEDSKGELWLGYRVKVKRLG